MGIMIHDRDALSEAAQEVLEGMRVVTLELGPGDRSWNPERHDTLLRGPATVRYVFWSDGGVDFTYKAKS